MGTQIMPNQIIHFHSTDLRHLTLLGDNLLRFVKGIFSLYYSRLHFIDDLDSKARLTSTSSQIFSAPLIVVIRFMDLDSSKAQYLRIL